MSLIKNNKALLKLSAEELKQYIFQNNITDNFSELNELFKAPALLNKFSSTELAKFIENEDGSNNLLWTLMPEYQADNKIQIHTEVFDNRIFLKLDSDSILNIINEKNEDVKGENILSYIASKGSKHNLEQLLNSPIYYRLNQESLKIHLLSENDTGDRVLDVVVNSNELFESFINSDLFNNIDGPYKYSIFMEKGCKKSSFMNLINYKTNKEILKILFNADSLLNINNSDTVLLMKEATQGQKVINEAEHIENLKILIDTKSFNALDCDAKLDLLSCEHIQLLNNDDCLESLSSQCELES